MIYPATGWFEMAQIPNKTAAEIADITEKTWFTCYPLPQRIMFDRGTEFMAEFSKMCKNDYGPLGHAMCRPHWSIYDPSKREKNRLNCGALQ